MFEKQTVPLTKVIPFAKTVPQWRRFPECSQKNVGNGTTFPKVELFWLHCEAVFFKKGKKWYHLIKSGAVSLRWYYFGSNLAPFHENGTTVPKRYFFSSSVILSKVVLKR